MNINIKSLKNDPNKDISLKNGYLYKDIAFDLDRKYKFNNQLNKKEYIKDVQSIFDVESIKNSLKNIFLTTPGDKILNPTFGLDLRQYLFEPVNNFIADIIKTDILDGLPDQEPRIKLENVDVISDADNQEYFINLDISIPSLNITGVSIKSKLKTDGYSIL